MSYVYDAEALHRYICAACNMPERFQYPELFAGIGKAVDGHLVGAFTVKGLGGGVYEFSGAITAPSAMRWADFSVMKKYLVETLNPSAVLAFSADSNTKAHRFLRAFGFKPCGSVNNYYGDGKTALMFQMTLESAIRSVAT